MYACELQVSVAEVHMHVMPAAVLEGEYYDILSFHYHTILDQLFLTEHILHTCWWTKNIEQDYCNLGRKETTEKMVAVMCSCALSDKQK